MSPFCCVNFFNPINLEFGLILPKVAAKEPTALLTDWQAGDDFRVKDSLGMNEFKGLSY